MIYSSIFTNIFQVKLFNEKRSDLEEQQLHLNIGLQKIRETVEQVEELQRSLSIKRNELEEKNNLANAKLKQMVSDNFAPILYVVIYNIANRKEA